MDCSPRGACGALSLILLWALPGVMSSWCHCRCDKRRVTAREALRLRPQVKHFCHLSVHVNPGDQTNGSLSAGRYYRGNAGKQIPRRSASHEAPARRGELALQDYQTVPHGTSPRSCR
ncbi:hypothetical protein NDU88_004376 [Pleurodeles waltl]|uniref:Secreted protein n=1 Tax=Pleurodeles waltl TaxID=8319 RepID=A0AAV7SIS1_PLEWA|nr:hypothetical protein NDU88_004376 [Pleurodeles waltl]